MVEGALCSDPCQTRNAASYDVAQLVASADGANDQRDAPIAPAQSESHHCNSMHAPAMAFAPQSVGIEQAFVSVVSWAPQLGPLQNEQGGQDRPPRATAIV
jgi:hypothetical protein